jgi:predicted nucleotidyltransferase
VRLGEREILIIKKAITEFDPEAEIFIFGSRADLSKKGGDIDILVLSDRIGWRERRKIRIALIKELGDRKIDLIVSQKDEIEEPIVKLALEEGVKVK